MRSSSSDSDSNSYVERIVNNNNEKLKQEIKSNDKKVLALKKLSNSSDKQDRTNKLKKSFHKLYKVIFDHLKKKIPTLGLGSNLVERYIEYLPDYLYFLWKFGLNGYDMHSTESKCFIRQAINKQQMQQMIKRQVKALITYNIAVKIGFNNGNDDYDDVFFKTPPNKQIFDVKKFVVNQMNTDKHNNSKMCNCR